MLDWSKIITAGVGPIIVISACGLLCLAFYNRLAAVITRLRTFHRERLHEQAALAAERSSPNPDGAKLVRHQEILGMLQVQSDRVTHRARLLRQCLGSLLLTIVCLALCSIAVGLSAAWPAAIYAAAPLFILGLLLLVVGTLFALAELHRALDPIELESRFIVELAHLEAGSDPP